MPAQLIEPSGHEKIVERSHNFYRPEEWGCGFAFDVDETGNLLRPNPETVAKFDALKATGEWNGRRYVDWGVEVNTRYVYHPPLYRCECGSTFHGDGDYQCRCGQWYNASGQKLDAHAMVCDAYANGFDCMCGEGE